MSSLLSCSTEAGLAGAPLGKPVTGCPVGDSGKGCIGGRGVLGLTGGRRHAGPSQKGQRQA